MISLTQPAKKPANPPKKVATIGGIPFIIETAVTAAPVTKLPSTVKSGKSNILKVKYTPRAMIAYIDPDSTAPNNAKNMSSSIHQCSVICFYIFFINGSVFNPFLYNGKKEAGTVAHFLFIVLNFLIN